MAHNLLMMMMMMIMLTHHHIMFFLLLLFLILLFFFLFLFLFFIPLLFRKSFLFNNYPAFFILNDHLNGPVACVYQHLGKRLVPSVKNSGSIDESYQGIHRNYSILMSHYKNTTRAERLIFHSLFFDHCLQMAKECFICLLSPYQLRGSSIADWYKQTITKAKHSKTEHSIYFLVITFMYCDNKVLKVSWHSFSLKVSVLIEE